MSDTNYQFQLAASFVNQTNKTVFLTGKAGTGKTTFLKYIQKTCFKKMAIVAPTGVAAINAGGVTLHSFFQLPMGMFVPTKTSIGLDQNISNQNSIFRNIKFNNAKRQLLNELELLVIDEVSMLRADMLDAVDTILRHFRRNEFQPFGGVQVLFIGDLYQLPPVVKNEEWGVLQKFYKSPFFFESHALKDNKPIYLELQKIYRQSELSFVRLLNKIRNNQADYDDLETLHKYYKPDFEPEEDESYITLTSHNAKADQINQSKLDKLSSALYAYEAEIKGDFNEFALPAEKVLFVKEGAQIMFIKNDKNDPRRYYNGKIATITRIGGSEIYVKFPGNEEEMLVEKEVWKNIRYKYDLEKDSVEEEELGTFSQYPIRLAWAVTIHKSQGLTFEKAIIDAGASFAPGQVYVALSRLTSIEGLVLYSRIQPGAISTDTRVVEFAENQMKEEHLEKVLEDEKAAYLRETLLRCFEWVKIKELFEGFYYDYELRNIPDKTEAYTWAKNTRQTIAKVHETASKFAKQMEQIMLTGDNKLLNERTTAASNYFIAEMDKEILSPLKKHIDEYKIKQRTKGYIKDLKEIELILNRKKQQLSNALDLASGILSGWDAEKVLAIVEEQRKTLKAELPKDDTEAKPKQPRGETRQISLKMYKEGKTIDEIATLRGMVRGTIEGHLASFIPTGEIQIQEIVSEEKIKKITEATEEVGLESSLPIKEKVGEDITYGEIRAVVSYLKLQEH